MVTRPSNQWEGDEKRMKVNYKPCNHCSDTWLEATTSENQSSHKSPHKADAENTIKFVVFMHVRKELTLTSVENCRLISSRKIPNRLIKSGKHNLLYNIQHLLSFFLQNQSSEC